MTPERIAHASRTLEDWGFGIGLGLMTLFGLAETAVYIAVSFSLVPRVDAPHPWILILFAFLAVLPKYMGRATAGQVWVILAKAIGAVISRGKSVKTGNTETMPAIEVEATCATCKQKMSVCVCPEPVPPTG